jgi:hypothetical protein
LAIPHSIDHSMPQHYSNSNSHTADTAPRLQLGEMLVSKGLISEEQLKQALERAPPGMRTQFDLDAPIGRYLKGLPDDKGNITARQILGHLAGFRHYGSDDYINTQKFANVDESLARLLAMPLLSAPGVKYAYSSYGFNVLGAVLQAAAGKEFREVIADEVTRPLLMTHTLAEVLPPPTGRTQLYGRGTQNELTVAPASDVSDRWPSGGFLSTAEDLVRLGKLRYECVEKHNFAKTSEPGEESIGVTRPLTAVHYFDAASWKFGALRQCKEAFA